MIKIYYKFKDIKKYCNKFIEINFDKIKLNKLIEKKVEIKKNVC
jgi:hypothetical protein